MGRGMASHTAWRARACCGRRVRGDRRVGDRCGRKGARETRDSGLPRDMALGNTRGSPHSETGGGPQAFHQLSHGGFSPALGMLQGQAPTSKPPTIGPGQHPAEGCPPAANSPGCPAPRLLLPSPPPTPGATSDPAPPTPRVPRESRPSSAPNTPLGSELGPQPQHQSPSSPWASLMQRPPKQGKPGAKTQAKCQALRQQGKPAERQHAEENLLQENTSWETALGEPTADLLPAGRGASASHILITVWPKQHPLGHSPDAMPPRLFAISSRIVFHMSPHAAAVSLFVSGFSAKLPAHLGCGCPAPLYPSWLLSPHLPLSLVVAKFRIICF